LINKLGPKRVSPKFPLPKKDKYWQINEIKNMNCTVISIFIFFLLIYFNRVISDNDIVLVDQDGQITYESETDEIKGIFY